MATGKRKEETITFKVDPDLAGTLAGIANRSDFIRQAIRAALGNTCPVCNGTGTLSVSQMRHWSDFARHHALRTCGDCRETHLVCSHEQSSEAHGGVH